MSRYSPLKEQVKEKKCIHGNVYVVLTRWHPPCNMQHCITSTLHSLLSGFHIILFVSAVILTVLIFSLSSQISFINIGQYYKFASRDFLLHLLLLLLAVYLLTWVMSCGIIQLPVQGYTKQYWMEVYRPATNNYSHHFTICRPLSWLIVWSIKWYLSAHCDVF